MRIKIQGTEASSYHEKVKYCLSSSSTYFNYIVYRDGLVKNLWDRALHTSVVSVLYKEQFWGNDYRIIYNAALLEFIKSPWSYSKYIITGLSRAMMSVMWLRFALQDALIDTVRRSRVHFVHCLLPKSEALSGEPRVVGGPSPRAGDSEAHAESCETGLMQLDVGLLRAQLRGSKLLDALRIYRQGRTSVCKSYIFIFCAALVPFSSDQHSPREDWQQ